MTDFVPDTFLSGHVLRFEVQKKEAHEEKMERQSLVSAFQGIHPILKPSFGLVAVSQEMRTVPAPLIVISPCELVA